MSKTNNGANPGFKNKPGEMADKMQGHNQEKSRGFGLWEIEVC